VSYSAADSGYSAADSGYSAADSGYSAADSGYSAACIMTISSAPARIAAASRP